MRPTAQLLLLGLALLVVLTALACGDRCYTPVQLWSAFSDNGIDGQVLWQLRLPRVVAAFVAGALLALAGVQMQVLLGNPLADPYILGTSGGAASGALLLLVLGGGGFAVAGAAFAGALLSTLIVFSLARSGGAWTPTRLLLTGVVVAAGWGALNTFILAIAPQASLRGMFFWLTGDLALAEMPSAQALLLLIGLLISLPLGRSLNLLARGETTAAALGVDVARLRLMLYLLTALLTAAAVTVAGTIGFVGLVIPHLLRLRFGSDHRFLLPASVIAGGTLVVLADTLARTLLAPQQLPVGVLTAFIGVPLFLHLLQRGYRP